MNYSQDIIDRFWSKVNVKYLDDGTPDFEACMLWSGWIESNGYGRFYIYRNNRISVHRFNYMCFNGPIPKDMCVCHTCDVRNCVNPNHLWLGTYTDNNKDRNNKNRQVKGTDVHLSKLNNEDVYQIILECINSKIIYIHKLSKKFKIARDSINLIIKGECWTHITYPIMTSYNLTFNDLQLKINKQLGSTNHMAILNEDKVRQIKILLRDTNLSQSQIANQFKIGKKTISNIATNKQWKHVTI